MRHSVRQRNAAEMRRVRPVRATLRVLYPYALGTSARISGRSIGRFPANSGPLGCAHELGVRTDSSLNDDPRDITGPASRPFRRIYYTIVCTNHPAQPSFEGAVSINVKLRSQPGSQLARTPTATTTPLAGITSTEAIRQHFQRTRNAANVITTIALVAFMVFCIRDPFRWDLLRRDSTKFAMAIILAALGLRIGYGRCPRCDTRLRIIGTFGYMLGKSCPACGVSFDDPWPK